MVFEFKLLVVLRMHIGIPTVRFRELASDAAGESSAAIRSRVEKARTIQHDRFKARKNLFCNARMESEDIRQLE